MFVNPVEIADKIFLEEMRYRCANDMYFLGYSFSQAPMFYQELTLMSIQGCIKNFKEDLETFYNIWNKSTYERRMETFGEDYVKPWEDLSDNEKEIVNLKQNILRRYAIQSKWTKN